jgi:hypothetical protein
MNNEISHVPPALIMLNEALAKNESLSNRRKILKGMLNELRDQSEFFFKSQIENARKENTFQKFEVHLNGDLDLLTNAGCSNLQCRVLAAERISRSMGLIADRIWLTDLITEKFIEFGRVTNAKLDYILEDLQVLFTIFPLISAGIVKFRTPWIVTCESCNNEFYSKIDDLTDILAKQFKSEFAIKKTQDGFNASVGTCVEPSMIYTGYDQKPPKKMDFAKSWIARQVHSALWTAREAAFTGGSIVSNSRIGLASLLQCDGRLINQSSLKLLDSERQFTVPWVNSLSPSQILELREEASQALPLFREKILKIMTTANESGKSATEQMFELREQAEQVRNELINAQKNSARYWKITYGLLGLGLSAYGVATDQVIPGVGGLLPILHLLINHKTNHDEKVDGYLNKPGYVLMKAQDILAHAHG